MPVKSHALIPVGLALAVLGGSIVANRRGQAANVPASKGLPDPRAEALSPDAWRREKRIIDLHQHFGGTPAQFDRAVRIMDPVGVGIGTNLGAGTVTKKGDAISVFEAQKSLADTRYPGRFIAHMTLDYSGWDEPDWSAKAVAQIEEGHRLGSAGLKEFKRLGLFLKDAKGELIKIDDPKLDPVWAKCGELGMPISIHVADPRAFWQPYDDKNERWEELKDHKNWWFGDPAKYPDRMALLDALDRVIARHRGTTFICVHFGNNPEEPEWVDKALERNPNMMIDIAARIPEIGRQDPEGIRAFFEKHQDRILFATDFMVYDKLILGSSGDEERPTDEDGVTFYNKCWRWFETQDRDWQHMTPIQGSWTINSIGLSPAVCRKVYFDSARKLFARSLPLPAAKATRIRRDFIPDGKLDEAEWASAVPVRLEYQARDASARPELSTPVRILWSDEFLYLSYECPYHELNTYEPAQEGERQGLWEKDVVELFLAPDAANPKRYTEHEWAPNGEKLDLKIDLPQKDFAWSSGMQSAVAIDRNTKVWRVEARIPLKALGPVPAAGTRWRMNLYRCDTATGVGLAFSPTFKGTFHNPDRFGWLEFAE